MVKKDIHKANLINIQDDAPKIVLGNLPEGRDELTPPFYITLELKGLHLHNFLYYSGASHSLIPLAVMEKLGLDITRPYKDLYSFHSKRVQCLGMIKDMVVTDGANYKEVCNYGCGHCRCSPYIRHVIVKALGNLCGRQHSVLLIFFHHTHLWRINS